MAVYADDPRAVEAGEKVGSQLGDLPQNKKGVGNTLAVRPCQQGKGPGFCLTKN